MAHEEEVAGLRDRLTDLTPREVVDELERLGDVDRAVAFRTLTKDRALAVFELLDPPLQSELVTALREETVAEIVAGLDPDDRAVLLDELPAGVANRLLRGLTPAERAVTTTMLGYPPDSVGRRMTPAVVGLPVGLTVGEALAEVRRREEGAETIYLLPVVDQGRRVVGVVSLRRLLVTDADVPVREVMVAPVTARADDDQEIAARLVREHGLVAMPVVDAEDRLLGIITVDDAMRILEAEESEDSARAGGTEPLRRPYLTTRVRDLVRSRIVWLLALIAAASLTVNVLDHFEDALAQVVTLALFVPLLIGTAGNTGAQAATTVVRAMALGDVEFRDLARVAGREALIGLLLGSLLASAALGPAWWVAGREVAVVVSVTLVVICTLATTVGSATPLLARRLGLDPAVVSAPFITTLVDSSGLVAYFLVARAVLGV